MTTLNTFDLLQMDRMDQVFTDKEGAITSGAGWKPSATTSPRIGIHNYRTNDKNRGNKQGLDLRKFKEIHAVGIRTGKIVPVSSGGAEFGQGVRLEGCGDSYFRDVHIDNERWLENYVNCDGFNENGNKDDPYADTTLYGIDWTILNPGETGFDCKKHNFQLHRGLIGGALENCAKFWRRKDGTFSEYTFDLRGAASSGKFFRLPSGDAFIKLWNCQFIDQNGKITATPPKALVTLDSGAVYDQIVELNNPPAYLNDPYFLGGQAPASNPDLLAQIAAIQAQVESLTIQLSAANLSTVSLQFNVVALEAQIVSLKEEIMDLNASLSATEQKILTAVGVLTAS